MASVSVLGTGTMGATLARALAGAGHEVVAWNRTFERARALAKGSMQAGSIRAVAEVDEAVAASQVVVVNVTNYEASREVLSAADGRLAGRIVVQTSSGTPEDSTVFQTWLTERGAILLEAAIIVYPKSIGTDESIIVYSGSEDAFAAIESLRRAWGGRQTLIGSNISLANAYASSSMTFYFGAISGFLEGATIAAAAGFPIPDYAKFTNEMLPVIAYTVEKWAELIDKRNYEFDEASLATMLDGLIQLVKAAQQAGISDSLMDLLRERVQRRIAAVGPRQHISSVFEEFRQL
jgi:3-hydroxyisobutyrate dehydrogenase-like beta-hydroxyacid dehydrogenase